MENTEQFNSKWLFIFQNWLKDNKSNFDKIVYRNCSETEQKELATKIWIDFHIFLNEFKHNTDFIIEFNSQFDVYYNYLKKILKTEEDLTFDIWHLDEKYNKLKDKLLKELLEKSENNTINKIISTEDSEVSEEKTISKVENKNVFLSIEIKSEPERNISFAQY